MLLMLLAKQCKPAQSSAEMQGRARGGRRPVQMQAEANGHEQELLEALFYLYRNG